MAAVKEVNQKARLVGINHVALEVGSIEEALSFYGQLFELSLRGRSAKIAFIDLGDQFINLSESHTQGRDEERHFGLVVDDKEKVRRRLKEAGVKTLPGRGVEFRDPWGTGCKLWSTRISSSPSTRRCSKAWVARTFTNRPRRPRSSPGKESHLREADAVADAGSSDV
jgi:predicted enzyme related to lactoylglutathione lyase